MAVELTSEERNKLIGGPLAAAMAVMAVDMGIFSSAQEAIALGRTLAGAAGRYSANPLIASLFDPEALKQGIRPEKLQVSPEDVRDGKLLDRALEEVDGAVALARAKGDAASEAATGGKGGGGGEGSATHIFQALQYLRKLSNHPKLVLGPEHPEMNNVNRMLKEQNMTIDDISLAPKLLALRQILWDCGIGTQEEMKKEGGDELGDVVVDRHDRHRVLIFAQMKGMLDIIEKDLFKKHLPSLTYLRMDGSTPNARRFEMQQQFNGDPSLVCVCVSLRANK